MPLACSRSSRGQSSLCAWVLEAWRLGAWICASLLVSGAQRVFLLRLGRGHPPDAQVSPVGHVGLPFWPPSCGVSRLQVAGWSLGSSAPTRIHRDMCPKNEAHFILDTPAFRKPSRGQRRLHLLRARLCQRGAHSHSQPSRAWLIRLAIAGGGPFADLEKGPLQASSKAIYRRE